MNTTTLINKIEAGEFDTRLAELYGVANIESQRARYAALAEAFLERYGERENVAFYSVPGRSEISGNHTDHNRGRVLAASIDLDIIACAAPTDDGFCRIASAGFNPDDVDLSSLSDYKNDHFCSSALIAGVCDGMAKRGYKTGAFCATTTSNVLKGSGLSSSAAFEVMVGNLFNYIYNDGKATSVELAQIAQYAENEYFGKPCGLMDQMACAYGGFIAIDFADPQNPVVTPAPFDMTGAGYSLCIVDTKGNHADLNDDYASIPAEMKAIAGHFGKYVLREVDEDKFWAEIPTLRRECGDRAVMRAIHFFSENRRVEAQADALADGDLETYFSLVLASGNSSATRLQNVYSTKNVKEQGLTLALALAERVLKGHKAAWRVHGGGFAGTIQAYVPHELVDTFRQTLEGVFGEGSVYVLSIRPEGATKL